MRRRRLAFSLYGHINQPSSLVLPLPTSSASSALWRGGCAVRKRQRPICWVHVRAASKRHRQTSPRPVPVGRSLVAITERGKGVVMPGPSISVLSNSKSACTYLNLQRIADLPAPSVRRRANISLCARIARQAASITSTLPGLEPDPSPDCISPNGQSGCRLCRHTVRVFPRIELETAIPHCRCGLGDVQPSSGPARVVDSWLPTRPLPELASSQ